MNNEEKILSLLENMGDHICKIETRLDKIESRIDKMDERIDKIETRLDKMDERIDKMDKRLSKVEEDVSFVRGQLVIIENVHLKKLNFISEGISGWQERNRQIDKHESKLENHGNRIWALEQVVKV
ncbi:MAG: hemolysin XhlA family protein [Oscillospiraceae bacterium]|jgi:septation ring formation regulator EzrA|nr:hemolysin XhlA family protein [Oscillospiraceae bacterium]